MNEFQFLAPDGLYRTVPRQSFSDAYMSGGVPVEIQTDVEVLSPAGILEKLYHRDAAAKIRTEGYRLLNDPKPVRLTGPDSRVYRINPQDVSSALDQGGSVILKEMSTSKPLNPQITNSVITDQDSEQHNWVGPTPKDPSRLKNWDSYTNILNKNKASRAGFFESIIPGWENIPWAGTVVGLAESGKIARTAERLRKGETVSDQDVLDLNIYLANMQRGSDATWGGQVGAVIRDSLTFSTELLLGTVATLFTGGSASPAFAAALAKKAGAVSARKATKEAAEALLTKGFTRNADDIVTGFAPGGQKLFTDFVTQRGVTSEVWRPFARDFGRTLFGRETADQLAAAGAKLTTAERAGGALADIASFALPPTLITSGIQAVAGTALGDGPATVRGNQQKLFDSLMNKDTETNSPFWYGVGDAMIENVSESLGRYLMLPFGKIGKAVGLEGAGAKIGSQIDNWTSRILNEAGEQAQKELATKTKGLTAFAAHATRKARDLQLSYDGVMKVFRDAGYDGVLEEMLEERAGGFMRGLFGFEGDAADNNVVSAFKGLWPGLEQLSVEAAAFSAPMLFSFGLPIALSPRGFARQYKDRQQLNEALRIAQSHMQGVSEEDIQKWEASNRPGVVGIESALPILNNIQNDYRTYREAGAQGGKVLRALNTLLDRVASAQYVEGRGMVLDPEVGFLATMSLPVGHYMETARSQYQGLKKGQAIPEKELEKVGTAAGLRAIVTLGKVATAYEKLDNVVPQDQMLTLLDKEELELAIDLGVIRRDTENKMLYLQPLETWNEADIEATMERINERAAKKTKAPEATVDGVAKVLEETVSTADPLEAKKQVYESLVGKIRETALDPAKALALENQGIRYFAPVDLGNPDVQKTERTVYTALGLRRRMGESEDPMSPQEIAYKAIVAPASLTPQELDAFTTVFGVASLFRGETLQTILQADFGKAATILRAAESGRIVLPNDTIIDRKNQEFKVVRFEAKDGVAGWRVEGKAGLIPESDIGLGKDFTVRPGAGVAEGRGIIGLTASDSAQGTLRQVVDELERMGYLETTIPPGISNAEWKRTPEAKRKELWDRMPEETRTRALNQRYKEANLPQAVIKVPGLKGGEVIYRYSTGALSFDNGRILINPSRQILAEGRYQVEDFIEGYLKPVGTNPETREWDSKQFWSFFPGLEKAYREAKAGFDRKEMSREEKQTLDAMPSPGSKAADIEIVSHIITDLALGFENANLATMLPWFNQLELLRSAGFTANSPVIRDAGISMQRIMGRELFEEMRYVPRSTIAARVEGRPAPKAAAPAPAPAPAAPAPAPTSAEDEAAKKKTAEEEAARKAKEEEAAKKKAAEDKAAKKKAAEEEAARKATEEEAARKAAEEEAPAEEEEAGTEKVETPPTTTETKQVFKSGKAGVDVTDWGTFAVAAAEQAQPLPTTKEVTGEGPEEPVPNTDAQDKPKQESKELEPVDSTLLFTKHPGLTRIAFTMGYFEKILKGAGLIETNLPFTMPYQFISERLNISFEEARVALDGVRQIPAAMQMLKASPLTQELASVEGFALQNSLVDDESRGDGATGPVFRTGEDFGAKYLSEAVKAVTAFTKQLYGFDVTLPMAQVIRNKKLPDGTVMGVDKLPAHYKNEQTFNEWKEKFDDAKKDEIISEAKRLIRKDKIPESGEQLLLLLTRLLPYQYSLNLINALQNSFGQEVISFMPTISSRVRDEEGREEIEFFYEASSRNTSTAPIVQQRIRDLLKRLTPEEYFGPNNVKLRQSLDMVRVAIDAIGDPELERSIGNVLVQATNPKSKQIYRELLDKFATAFSRFMTGTNSAVFKEELLTLLSNGSAEKNKGAEIRLQLFNAWRGVLSPLQKLQSQVASGKISQEKANIGLQNIVENTVRSALGMSEDIDARDLGTTGELRREGFKDTEYLKEALFRLLPKDILQITGRGGAVNRQASGLVPYTTRYFATEQIARKYKGRMFLAFDTKTPGAEGIKVSELTPDQAVQLFKDVAESEFRKVQTGQVGKLFIYNFLTGDKGDFNGIVIPLTTETEIAPGRKMASYLTGNFEDFYRDVYTSTEAQPGLAERINIEVLNSMLGEDVNKMKVGDAVKRASQLATPSIRPVVNVDDYIQTDANGNVEYIVALIPDGKGGFTLPNGPGDGLVAMIPGKEGQIKKSSKVSKDTQAMVKLGYIGRTDKGEMVQIKGAVVAFDGKDGMPELGEGSGITPASLQKAMGTATFKKNTKNAVYFVSGSSLKLKPEFTEQFTISGITFAKFKAPPLGLVSPMPDNSVIRDGFMGPQVYAGVVSVATSTPGNTELKSRLAAEFLKEVFGDVRQTVGEASRISRGSLVRQMEERYPGIALLVLNNLDAPWMRSVIDRMREKKLIQAAEGEIQKTINAIRSASNDAVEAVNTAPEGTRDPEYGFLIIDGKGTLPLLSPYQKLPDGRLSAPRMAMSVMLTSDGEQISSEDLIRLENKMGRPLATFEEGYLDTLVEKLSSTFNLRTKAKKEATRKIMQDLLRPVRDDSVLIPLDDSTPFGKTPGEAFRFVAWLQANEKLLLDLADVTENGSLRVDEPGKPIDKYYAKGVLTQEFVFRRENKKLTGFHIYGRLMFTHRSPALGSIQSSQFARLSKNLSQAATYVHQDLLKKIGADEDGDVAHQLFISQRAMLLGHKLYEQLENNMFQLQAASNPDRFKDAYPKKWADSLATAALPKARISSPEFDLASRKAHASGQAGIGFLATLATALNMTVDILNTGGFSYSTPDTIVKLPNGETQTIPGLTYRSGSEPINYSDVRILVLNDMVNRVLDSAKVPEFMQGVALHPSLVTFFAGAIVASKVPEFKQKPGDFETQEAYDLALYNWVHKHTVQPMTAFLRENELGQRVFDLVVNKNRRTYLAVDEAVEQIAEEIGNNIKLLNVLSERKEMLKAFNSLGGDLYAIARALRIIKQRPTSLADTLTLVRDLYKTRDGEVDTEYGVSKMQSRLGETRVVETKDAKGKTKKEFVFTPRLPPVKDLPADHPLKAFFDYIGTPFLEQIVPVVKPQMKEGADHPAAARLRDEALMEWLSAKKDKDLVERVKRRYADIFYFNTLAEQNFAKEVVPTQEAYAMFLNFVREMTTRQALAQMRFDLTQAELGRDAAVEQSAMAPQELVAKYRTRRRELEKLPEFVNNTVLNSINIVESKAVMPSKPGELPKKGKQKYSKPFFSTLVAPGVNVQRAREDWLKLPKDLQIDLFDLIHRFAGPNRPDYSLYEMIPVEFSRELIAAYNRVDDYIRNNPEALDMEIPTYEVRDEEGKIARVQTLGDQWRIHLEHYRAPSAHGYGMNTSLRTPEREFLVPAAIWEAPAAAAPAPRAPTPTANTLALVEEAKPPRAYAAKERAKGNIANKVLAPLADNVSDKSYAKRIGQAARKAGVLVQNVADVNPGDVIYVSIPGQGRGQTIEQLQAQIGNVLAAVAKGATVVTDNQANAERDWNILGEGELRKALLAIDAVEESFDTHSQWTRKAGAEAQPTAAIATSAPQALAWSANRKARQDMDIPENRPVVGKGVSTQQNVRAREIMRSFNSRWKPLATDIQAILDEDGKPVQDKVDSVRAYIADKKAKEQWPRGAGGAAFDRNLENMLRENYSGTERLEDITEVGEQAMLEEMRGAVEAEVERGAEREELRELGYTAAVAISDLSYAQQQSIIREAGDARMSPDLLKLHKSMVRIRGLAGSVESAGQVWLRELRRLAEKPNLEIAVGKKEDILSDITKAEDAFLAGEYGKATEFSEKALSKLHQNEYLNISSIFNNELNQRGEVPATAALAAPRQVWSPEAQEEQRKLGVFSDPEALAPRSGYHPKEGVNLAEAESPANQPYDPETKQGRFTYPSRWRKAPPLGMVNSFEKTLLDLGIIPQIDLSLQDGNAAAMYPSVGVFQGDREALPLAVSDYLVKHVLDESVGRRQSALSRNVDPGRYPLFNLGRGFEDGPHSDLVAEELKRQLYGSRTLFTSPNNPVSRLVRTLMHEIENGNLGTLLQRGVVTMDKAGEFKLTYQSEPRELVELDRLDSPPPIPLTTALDKLVPDKSVREVLDAALDGQQMVTELRGLYDAGKLDYDMYRTLLESAAYQSGLTDPYARSLGGPDVSIAIAAAIPPPNTRAALLKTAGVPGAHFLLWESMNEMHVMERDTGEFYNWTSNVLGLNSLEVLVWDPKVKNANRADGTARTDGRWDKRAEKITLTLEEARQRDDLSLLIRNLIQYRDRWEDGTWRSQKAVRPKFTPQYMANELARDKEGKIVFEEDLITLGELYDGYIRSSYRKKMLENAGRTEELMDPMNWARQYADKFDADNRILNQKFSWAFDGREFMPYLRDYFPRNSGSLRYADPLNQLVDTRLYELERSADERISRLAGDTGIEDALKVERSAQAKMPTEPMTKLLDELLTAKEKERLVSVETGQYTITAPQAANWIRRKLAARVRSEVEKAVRESPEDPQVALQSLSFFIDRGPTPDPQVSEIMRDLATIAQISRLNRGPRFTEWASAEFSRTLGRTDYEAYVNSQSTSDDKRNWYRPESYNFADVRRQYVLDTYNAALNKAMLSGFITITDPEGRPLMMAKPVPNMDLDKNPITRGAWIKAAQIQSDAAKLETPFDPTQTDLVQEIIRVYNDSRNRINSDNKVVKSPKAASVEEWTTFDGPSKAILEQVIQVPFTETSKTFRALMSAVQWTKRLSVGFSGFFYVALGESSISASGLKRNLAVKLVSDKKFRDQFLNGVREFKALREYYDPQVAARARAMAESGLRSSGPGVAIDLPNTIVDTQMAQMVGWMKEKKGEKEANLLNYILTGDSSAYKQWPGTKLWPGLSGKKWSDAMFAWFSAVKEYQAEMIMMNQAIDAGINVDSALNAPTWYSRRASQFMNETLGGVNWPQMMWTTPSVMAGLNLTLFATNWTAAAIQSSGLGYLLQRVKLNGIPLGTNYAPGQGPMIAASLVAMYFVVMQAIPIALQAAAYAAGQALGGDPDDTPFPWNNDPTRTDRIDMTPLMRHSPFYKGDPTGERRMYIQFAKQVHETGVLNPFGTRGWINEPYGQLMRKLSMPARYVVEMVTGQSPGSDWDLEFKGKGMLGWINSGAPGFEGVWTSRLGYAAQKLIPLSFTQLMDGLETAPLNFFAPLSKGMSKTAITNAMVETLQTYASREDWRRIRQVPRARAKLDTFMPELMLAAERNGYNAQQLLDSSRGIVLSQLYKNMWNALDRDDTAGMNEAAASIMRVGGQVKGLVTSLTSRERTFGKPVSDEMKQKAVDALEQAYNGQF
jgi:hypothetical protein